MDNKKGKKIIVGILAIFVAILAGLGFYEENQNKPTEEIVNNVKNEVSNYIEIKEENNKSSTEIPTLTENDEQTLEVQETNVEDEGFNEQGEIAYNGSDKTPNIQVGDYAGLTYYSQLDSRWRYKAYTSVGDNSQTIGTSGCGPTSAAMIVSSIKGTITPDTMASLYVNHGYRSASQGTYWSAFKWTADVFDIEYSECFKLDDVINKLKDNNYIIVSCNQGLFTYGGHFIVLVGVEGDYIKIYDPYLYAGKFNVSTRRGKATVDGNTVYVSIENFRNYANYQKFFCFKNNRTEIKNNIETTVNIKKIEDSEPVTQNTNYQVIVTANSGLNVRSGASTNYSRIGVYAKNTILTITSENNNWGKTNIGWVSLQYTSRNINISSPNLKNTVGKTKKLASDSKLYSNANLTGLKYDYKANTTITILENISNNVDKVKVNATGRIAYIDNRKYIEYNQIIKQSNIGNKKHIRNCYLYSKSSLTGIKYSYRDNTTVTILQHINSYTDKIKVNATGRTAFINTKYYK